MTGEMNGRKNGQQRRVLAGGKMTITPRGGIMGEEMNGGRSFKAASTFFATNPVDGSGYWLALKQP